MQLRQGEIKYAVIHHPGELNEYTAEETKKVHLDRGFGDVGYNYLIEKDGKVVKGRDEKYRGAHTVVENSSNPQYWNEHALGICLVHNGEESAFPDVMYKSAAKLLKEKGFKTSEIFLHSEVDATKCPGKYFDKNKLLKYVKEEEGEKDYKDHWAESSIDKVRELGIMTGYPNGDFEPNQLITRAEVAVIIVNLYEKLQDNS